MAKSKAISMPASGGFKGFVLLVAVIALVVMVVKDPVGAAGIAKSAWNTVAGALDSVITFFQSLSS